MAPGARKAKADPGPPAGDPIFEPLHFRNLTVKNRLFRSNISGRFDNYNGTGNPVRFNWETKSLRMRLLTGANNGPNVANRVATFFDPNETFHAPTGTLNCSSIDRRGTAASDRKNGRSRHPPADGP